MMKKLYKWDLIHYFNQLKWVVIGTLFVTVLTVLFKILMGVNFVWEFFYQTTFIISIASIIISSVYAFFVILQRYYHSILKDEAYFTHTLPISKGKILLSKICSGFTLFLLTILTALGLLIWIGVINVELFLSLRDLDERLFTMSLLSILSSVIMFFVFIVVSYAALTFGFSYNKREWLYVFIYYIMYYIANQFLSAVNLGINLIINPGILTIEETDIFGALTGIIVVQLILSVGLGVLNYFIARYLMTKKLNLKNG